MFEALKAIDRRVLLEINSHHHPVFDKIMWFVSLTTPTIVLILAIAFYLYKIHHIRRATHFLLGCAIVFACCDLSSNAIKHQVKRYRPTHNVEIGPLVHTVNNYRGGQYTFFSGHAANTFGLITFVFLCLHNLPLRWRLLLFVYPLIVVYSRMYLGVHYPSDILTGTVVGLIFGTIVYKIINKHFFAKDESFA